MAKFLWDHYIAMNPDLNLRMRGEATTHWETIGRAQMRLCNRNQLEVVAEFGMEIILHVGYYYYLYTNGLLFDNKITTYRGMREFYYFVRPENLVEKDELRRCLDPPFFVNNLYHVHSLDERYWTPPPYKAVFASSELGVTKPILLIHNKYTIEWGDTPINFIGTQLLREICAKFSHTYQIIYERAINTSSLVKRGYSADVNTIIDDLDDYAMLKAEFPKVVLFNDIVPGFENYNALKLRLYAKTDNFITVQGGGAPCASFFATKLLILHKRGSETNNDIYSGWLTKTNNNPKKQIVVSLTDADLLRQLDMFNSAHHCDEGGP